MSRREMRGLTPVGLLVAFVFLGAPGGAPSDGGSLRLGGALKEHLDLPYDALGSSGEEEEAPEAIFFYGQQYEASAIVFALDKSGSMNEEGRWALQSREVTRSLSQLGADAEFGVVYYGSDVNAFRETPVPADPDKKRAGIAFVRAQSPGGDTCTAEGVVKALEIVRRSSHRHKAVIVTSDGRPDVCATGNRANAQEIQRILAQTLKANPGLKVKVHTIFVGRNTAAEAIQFMRRLAEVHGGTFRLVTH